MANVERVEIANRLNEFTEYLLENETSRDLFAKYKRDYFTKFIREGYSYYQDEDGNYRVGEYQLCVKTHVLKKAEEFEIDFKSAFGQYFGTIESLIKICLEEEDFEEFSKLVEKLDEEVKYKVECAKKLEFFIALNTALAGSDKTLFKLIEATEKVLEEWKEYADGPIEVVLFTCTALETLCKCTEEEKKAEFRRDIHNAVTENYSKSFSTVFEIIQTLVEKWKLLYFRELCK